jgi:hypothetical protein
MSNLTFSGGDNLVPGTMEHRAYEIMMKSELRNGRGAYEMGNAGAAASGPSFGPFQYDIGNNRDGRDLLELIAKDAVDDHGHRLISEEQLVSIKTHLYKPFNSFTQADRSVYTAMKPKLDAALSSDDGIRAINADFVPCIQKKVATMNAVVDGMRTEPNKTFVQHSDVAQLILIDTGNQYGEAVNDGLKQFVDRTHDDPAMRMPGRSGGVTIKVNGEFGLEDMIRYKLETQYGQNNQGARDVLRRISHCIEAAGIDKVEASLSQEDKAFFETGLNEYLKDHGRDTTILDDPQLAALSELGGREEHRVHSPANDHNASSSTWLRQGSEGQGVIALQKNLASLGYTDAHGRQVHADGHFGPATKQAVEKFQRAEEITPDGIVGTDTLRALQVALRPPLVDLSDATHPGNVLYLQSLDAVHRLDAQRGRTPDLRSNNLAAALAVAAHGKGISQVDHVVLSEDASRAFAIQGDARSLIKRHAEVDVAQAVATPVAQSSTQWPLDIPQLSSTRNAQPLQQTQLLQVDQSAMQR